MKEQGRNKLIKFFKSCGAQQHFASTGSDRELLLCNIEIISFLQDGAEVVLAACNRRAEGDLEKGPTGVEGLFEIECFASKEVSLPCSPVCYGAS